MQQLFSNFIEKEKANSRLDFSKTLEYQSLINYKVNDNTSVFVLFDIYSTQFMSGWTQTLGLGMIFNKLRSELKGNHYMTESCIDLDLESEFTKKIAILFNILFDYKSSGNTDFSNYLFLNCVENFLKKIDSEDYPREFNEKILQFLDELLFRLDEYAFKELFNG